ncbi:MAG: phage tail protein [Desulfovibrio sp.]|nr:phage tail protein [Desulfovibrio sp.]
MPEESVNPAAQQYYTCLTDAGAALEAAAHAAAKPVVLTHVAVGDGNGEVPAPAATATALVHEVYRRQIEGRERDKEDPRIAWLHIIIPADVGGFWIREFGIYAAPLEEGGEPVLYAYGNHAPYYKQQTAQGQATTHELSIPIILSGTAEVEISVKDAGYASQLAFEDLRTEVEADRKRLWENDGEGPKLLTAVLPQEVVLTSKLGPGLFQGEDGIVDVVPRFAVCTTDADVAAKTVTLQNAQTGPGSLLYLRFAHVNTATELTLAVNDAEAKPLLWQGVCPEVGDLAKGQVYTVLYTGDDWQILAGMAPWNICQTVWFEDTLERPGMIPLNGCTVPNFSAKWPQAFAYLQTAHGQARCFETLAEREAAHVAIWHTLASGATVGWEGFGGVCKFFYDPETDTLYMPDLRGMFRAMAGDGSRAPSMGGVMGDRIRNITGNTRLALHTDRASNSWTNQSGAFSMPNRHTSDKNGTAGERYSANLVMDSSLVVPVGAANVSRSWGSLACAYFGQQSAA